MKKWSAYIAIVLVVASCINKPDISDDATRIIEFDVVSYPSKTPFKVWAYDADEVVINGHEVMCSDKRWSTEQKHVWPSEQARLDFFAYSPAEAQAQVSKETGITFSGFDISANNEFLCAEPVIGASMPQTDSPLYMIFDTPLCEIEFQAYSSSGEGVAIWINRIELRDLAHIGDFRQLPSKEWSGLKDNRSTNVFEGRIDLTNIPQKVGEDILIIPQKLNPIIYYSYKHAGSDIEKKDSVLLDMKGAPGPASGKKRTYTIKVTEDAVIIPNPNS